jgi:hypothetical protein
MTRATAESSHKSSGITKDAGRFSDLRLLLEVMAMESAKDTNDVLAETFTAF